jgi:hypothetical protein
VNITRVFKPGAADQQQLLEVLELLLSERPAAEPGGQPARSDPSKRLVSK